MSRRHAIAAAGAALVPALFRRRGVTAAADEECRIDAYGRRYCIAGIPSFVAQGFAKRQNMMQWCWAASISMVFNHYGHPVSQARIVRDAYGGIVNMPGYPPQILASLNRRWVDEWGRPFVVRADALSANYVTAIADLRDNHPQLVGALGHMVVLTAISYYPTPAGPRVAQAMVRDPWPGSASRRVLTPQEWYNVKFAARVRVYDG